MQRRLLGVGLWLGATALSVAVVMGGVRLVADSVNEPLTLVAAESREDGPVDTQPSSRGTGRSRTGSPTPATTAPDDEMPAQPQTDDPEAPAASDPPDAPPAPTSAPPTTAAPTDGATPTPTSTPTETDESEDDEADPPPSDRAYELEGGSVGIRFSATRVEVLYATPRDGFVVRVLRESETRVVVTFRSSSHISELEARWDNGPRADAEEDDADNSGRG